MSWLKETLSAANGQLSSKRICGAIGFVASVALATYCTIKIIQAPTIVDSLLYGSIALLGTDAVASIWKKKDE